MLSIRRIIPGLIALMALLAAHDASGAGASKPESTAVAVFAGGCFWCEEATFEGREGVLSVTSGYTGGQLKHPRYEDVGTGMSGHFESIEIVYDPRRTTYEKLLDIFWHNVDPTQGDGQFCDRGPEYRSAIFTRDETQRRLALESKRRIEASGQLKKPIVTLIVAVGAFYPAEDYHQDYARKNPAHYGAYRLGCGRDARLLKIWGTLDTHAAAH